MARRMLSAALGLATICAAALAAAAPAAADPLPDEVTAYVWADRPALSSYNPDSQYAYNSTGGDIVIYRQSTGKYTVVFDDAGIAASGGVVHVQAYGSNPQIVCTVIGWGPTLFPVMGGLQINVRCFTAPNTLVDSTFVASFANAVLSGTGRFTYLWTDQAAPVGVRTLTHAYQYDSQGGPLSYQRLGIGTYQVNLPPNPPGLASIFPMVHVTPYANEWVACEIGWPDQRIVTCSRADGDPVDTRFTLTYGLKVDLTGHRLGLFGSGVLYEDTISGAVINGDAYVSSYPTGGGMAGAVLGTGSYVMTLRGIGADGGHAIVTEVAEPDPDAPPRGKCSVAGWWRAGADEKVRVACSGFGPAFSARDLNVRVTFTNYHDPV